MSRSKRLVRGRLRGSDCVEPPCRWQVTSTGSINPGAYPHFLVANVVPNHGFVPADGRHQIPSRPEILAAIILLSFSVRPRQVDRALAIDVPNRLLHYLLRRYRDLDVNMVRHATPFLDLASLICLISQVPFSGPGKPEHSIAAIAEAAFRKSINVPQFCLLVNVEGDGCGVRQCTRSNGFRYCVGLRL